CLRRELCTACLQGVTGRGRQVGQAQAGHEEGAGCPPGEPAEEAASSSSAEDLLCTSAAKSAHATALSRLEEDNKDEEHAGEYMDPGQDSREKLSHGRIRSGPW